MNNLLGQVLCSVLHHLVRSRKVNVWENVIRRWLVSWSWFYGTYNAKGKQKWWCVFVIEMYPPPQKEREIIFVSMQQQKSRSWLSGEKYNIVNMNDSDQEANYLAARNMKLGEY